MAEDFFGSVADAGVPVDFGEFSEFKWNVHESHEIDASHDAKEDAVVFFGDCDSSAWFAPPPPEGDPALTVHTNQAEPGIDVPPPPSTETHPVVIKKPVVVIDASIKDACQTLRHCIDESKKKLSSAETDAPEEPYQSVDSVRISAEKHREELTESAATLIFALVELAELLGSSSTLSSIGFDGPTAHVIDALTQELAGFR